MRGGFWPNTRSLERRGLPGEARHPPGCPGRHSAAVSVLPDRTGCGSRGREVLDAAQAAIEYVFRRPGVGSPKVFKNAALKELRSWPVKGFSAIRIYYLASEGEVRVIRVLHGKRDIDLLLESAGEVE